jgi:hypothetical protein
MGGHIMVLKRSVIVASGSGSSAASNDFTITTGGSGFSKTTLTTSFPAGDYVVTSSLSDSSMDIYLVAEDGTLAGVVNTLAAQSTVTASKSFNAVVVYGATNNDTITFQFKYVFSLTIHGDSDINVGPRVLSISNANLNVNGSTTITGRNFATDAAVVFKGSDGVSRSAKSVTRNSSTSLTVVRPDAMPAQFAPYEIIVTNPSTTNPTSSNVNRLTSAVNTEATAPTITGVSKLSSTQAQISFTAPSSNGNSAVTNYKFSTDGVNYTALSPAQTASPLTVTVTTNTTYTFYIKAVNGAGDSVASNQSSSIFIGNPVVSGGTLSNDGTYFYRTFNSSGTLTVSSTSLTSVDYVITGGGGSSTGSSSYAGPAWECNNAYVDYATNGGGGGGGGVRYLSSQTISTGSHSISVGGGGSPSSAFSQSSGTGTNGTGENGGTSGSPQNNAGAPATTTQSGSVFCDYHGYTYYNPTYFRRNGGGGGGSNGAASGQSGGGSVSYFGSSYGSGGQGGSSSTASGAANTGNGGTKNGSGGSGRVVIRYPMSNVTNA